MVDTEGTTMAGDLATTMEKSETTRDLAKEVATTKVLKADFSKTPNSFKTAKGSTTLRLGRIIRVRAVTTFSPPVPQSKLGS